MDAPKIIFDCRNCRHKDRNGGDTAGGIFCLFQKRTLAMPVKCRSYKNLCSHMGEKGERCDACVIDPDNILECELGYS